MALFLPADFTQYNEFAHEADWNGGADGVARLHSAITPALSGADPNSYCREYHGPGGGRHRQSMVLNKAGFVNPPWKAWSIRADVKAHLTSSNCSIRLVGSGSTGGTNLFSMYTGYGLALGKFDQEFGVSNGTFGLRLLMNKGDWSTGTKTGVMVSTALAAGQWHKLRLDAIKLDSQHELRVYVHDGTSWVLEHTEVILNTDNHFSTSGQFGYGNLAVSSPSGLHAHIDNFQVLIKE